MIRTDRWQYQCSDPGCLSRIRIFSIPDSGSKFFPSRIRIFPFRMPDPHQRISVFYPKNCFLSPGNMIRVVHPGSGSRGRKAKNPGSGSYLNTGQYLSLQSHLSERVLILAILVASILIKIFKTITRKKSGYHVQNKRPSYSNRRNFV